MAWKHLLCSCQCNILLHVQIENAMHRDLEYLTDPAQNVVKDFFNGATRSGSSVGSVSGDHCSKDAS